MRPGLLTGRRGLPLRRRPDNRLPVMRAAAAALLILCCLPVLARGDPMAVAMVPGALCPATTSLTTPARHLDRLAAAIEASGPVEILAVGSATTSGQDSSGDNAFPRRAAKSLRDALPGIPLRLIVRGGIGMPASEMLPLIEAALREYSFQLVIWQTGTVEAVHGVPSAELRATLEAGAAQIHKAGADLVLIGPQFSRILSSKADLAPYEQALKDTASLPGVVLFDRLDLTRDWVRDGRVDLERAAKADRASVLETLHACVGASLARFILTGAGQP
jgi:acyl-CoA thioesterase I